VRESLRSLLQRLADDRFVRVHRSAAINTDRVREIQPLFHGDHVVILHSGEELRVSRRYWGPLSERLGAGAARETG